MNRNYRPTSSGWAVVLLSVAALALGACGRKAGLDLPPSASPQAAAAAAAAEPGPQPPVQSNALQPKPGKGSGGPRAAKGVKQPFILDPLLDD